MSFLPKCLPKWTKNGTPHVLQFVDVFGVQLKAKKSTVQIAPGGLAPIKQLKNVNLSPRLVFGPQQLPKQKNTKYLHGLFLSFPVLVRFLVQC